MKIEFHELNTSQNINQKDTLLADGDQNINITDRSVFTMMMMTLCYQSNSIGASDKFLENKTLLLVKKYQSDTLRECCTPLAPVAE